MIFCAADKACGFAFKKRCRCLCCAWMPLWKLLLIPVYRFLMHNTKTKQEKIQKPLFHAAVHQPAALRWLSRPARGKKEGWLRIEAVCSSALSLQGSKQFFLLFFFLFVYIIIQKLLYSVVFQRESLKDSKNNDSFNKHWAATAPVRAAHT